MRVMPCFKSLCERPPRSLRSRLYSPPSKGGDGAARGASPIGRSLKKRRRGGRLNRLFRQSAYAAGACLVLLAAPFLSAQIPSSIPYTGQYNRGQDVVPVYEGWKPNPDGTFTMYFGYFNRNYEEELDIPLGPNNSIDPGGDRGQPTHFYPRRQLF